MHPLRPPPYGHQRANLLASLKLRRRFRVTRIGLHFPNLLGVPPGMGGHQEQKLVGVHLPQRAFSDVHAEIVGGSTRVIQALVAPAA